MNITLTATLPWESYIRPTPERRLVGDGVLGDPEHAPHLMATGEDDGCGYGGPHCLECKLPACVFEANHSSIKRRIRYAAIRERYHAGHDKERIAMDFGVSMRTVHRALAGAA